MSKKSASKKSAKNTILKKIHKAQLHHKMFFTFIGIFGVIVLWRGIWTLVDSTPVVNHPILSIFLGLLIVLISGKFFKLV